MPKLIPDVVEAGSLAAQAQPTIAIDDELLLRPFDAASPGDIEAVVRAFDTTDIQYFHFRRLDAEESVHWITAARNAWQAETGATWAITSRRDGSVLGRVSVYLRLVDGAGEVSYWVLPEARGRGVATRACRTATRWAHQVGIHRVELQHAAVNVGSEGVARAAGFLREGVQRGAGLLVDGWHDMVLHSHLATDPA